MLSAGGLSRLGFVFQAATAKASLLCPAAAYSWACFAIADAPYLNNFNRLCAAHTKLHSASQASWPRIENSRKPMHLFIWPNTGSTVSFRRPYLARPSSVSTFDFIRSRVVLASVTGSGFASLYSRCFSRQGGIYTSIFFSSK